MQRKIKSRSWALGPVLKLLMISIAYGGGGSYAQACDVFFGDVIASAQVREGESYSSLTGKACGQYAIEVPERLYVAAQYSSRLLVALHIGKLTFCYVALSDQELKLVGYTGRRDCTARTTIAYYYSALLEPGEFVELEVLEGYGAVSTKIEGLRP